MASLTYSDSECSALNLSCGTPAARAEFAAATHLARAAASICADRINSKTSFVSMGALLGLVEVRAASISGVGRPPFVTTMSGTDQTPRGLSQLPHHGFSPVCFGGRASFFKG
jgi:hypothetical protein